MKKREEEWEGDRREKGDKRRREGREDGWKVERQCHQGEKRNRGWGGADRPGDKGNEYTALIRFQLVLN